MELDRQREVSLIRAGMRISIRRGEIACLHCRALNYRTSEGAPCARCGAILDARKRDSTFRTWSFLISAFLLYLPANILPVMETTTILGKQRDTIISGVGHLWQSGAWALAIAALLASVVVPLVKMLALTLFLLFLHRPSRGKHKQLTRLYELIEIIGRWSMLDVFVIALLTAMVQASPLATIMPGPGAAAFGAVVVLTMLAMSSFDPRLMWDAVDDEDARS